ncbi:MAG: hypothetical protein CL561_07265 [Alphaproteobacteria bacterium]|nr:hypothetical protein [Alphaproteobacteria bacterium]|tara:strand:- start:3076 stop:3624 length:549 start_codon:yes stop_codon:yes gene_type:complete
MTENQPKQQSDKPAKSANKKTKADMAALGVRVEAKKSKKKLYIGGGVCLVFALIMYWGLKPIKASPNYGVCKTYVELSVPYPHTLKFMDLYDRKLFVRMKYSYVDPYGQTIFFPITCQFARDENGRKYLEKVDVNRDKSHPLEEQDKIDSFNNTMGVGLFGTYKPDLVRPPKIPKRISKYKR